MMLLVITHPDTFGEITIGWAPCSFVRMFINQKKETFIPERQVPIKV